MAYERMRAIQSRLRAMGKKKVQEAEKAWGMIMNAGLGYVLSSYHRYSQKYFAKLERQCNINIKKRLYFINVMLYKKGRHHIKMDMTKNSNDPRVVMIILRIKYNLIGYIRINL